MEYAITSKLAVIGGTGIDKMLKCGIEPMTTISTRFGDAQVAQCQIGSVGFVFLPRHGPDHSIAPHLINHRANITALTSLGVNRAIGLCSAGSLTTTLQPGSVAILGDFIDLTKQASTTLFDEPGDVRHTDFSQPYCTDIARALFEACRVEDAAVMRDAVYVGVDGPRYETPAEIRLYGSWGGHVVGMTNVPEAIIAREAGLCYGALAIVTNLGTGLSPTPLTHEEVESGVAKAYPVLQRVLARAISDIPAQRTCACNSSNENAK